jgi:SPP1 family predicted phage head-tail adaptor
MGKDCLVRNLRHRIVIEAGQPASDGGGGGAGFWTNPLPVARAWAHIEPLRGREALASMKLESRITHRITLRYRAGISAAMRVAFKGRYFNIRAVINPEERNEILELLCEEGVAT